MSAEPIRVLGIDTSLRSTGIGVVEAVGHQVKAIDFRTIKVPAGRPLSECLRRLHLDISEVIRLHKPEAAAIEGVFFFKNVKTAVILGEARGAVIAACAAQNLPVFEYPPRRVKQAVLGMGGAGKEQVGRMVMTLLSLAKEPREDECDALAIAICHHHNRSTHAALAPAPL